MLIADRSHHLRKLPLLFLLALIGTAVFDAPAHAQTSATGMIGVTIIKGSFVTGHRPLSFDRIRPGTAGGTITAGVNSSAIATGGSTSVEGVQAAAFSIGSDAHGFQLTLPAEPVIVTSGDNTMAVHGFTGPSVASGPAGDQWNFGIGASVTVRPDQPVGTYAGTFLVEVNYE